MSSLFGEFFLNLLEQDRVWETRDGRVLPVEDLEPRHRANVLRMLERHRPDLYREWVGEFVDEGVGYGELAAVGIGSIDPVTGRYRLTGAVDWFEAQPLIRRLRELQADETVGSARA